MICPHCKVTNHKGNFCAKCGRKLQDICNCWVLKRPYNCEQEKCPGYRFFTEEAKKLASKITDVLQNS